MPMMTCPACGDQSTAQAKFCLKCGHALAPSLDGATGPKGLVFMSTPSRSAPSSQSLLNKAVAGVVLILVIQFAFCSTLATLMR